MRALAFAGIGVANTVESQDSKVFLVVYDALSPNIEVKKRACRTLRISISAFLHDLSYAYQRFKRWFLLAW
jgi:hypothetical protein